MNKNIKLAVAGAVLAMSATAANAGIIIPAGDWTLDINGNVNAYANWTKADHSESITGGLAKAKDAVGEDKTQGINTGLLPSWLGFTGTTRQMIQMFHLRFQCNQMCHLMAQLVMHHLQLFSVKVSLLLAINHGVQ